MNGNDGEFERVYDIDLTLPGREYSLKNARKSYRVKGLRVTEHCKQHQYRVPLEPMVYEQIGFGDSLGFVFWGSGTHEGHEFILRFVIRKTPEGRILLSPPEMTPMKGHTTIETGMTVVYSTK